MNSRTIPTVFMMMKNTYIPGIIEVIYVKIDNFNVKKYIF